MENNQLQHFGVIGMKWGHHKQQVDDTSKRSTSESDDYVLKKGQAIQNISSNVPRELRTKTPLYASYKEVDNANYAGWYADTLKNWMDVKPYKNEFVISKDIKVASDKKAAEKFIEMYKKDPDGLNRAIASTVVDRSMLANMGKKVLGLNVEDITAKRYAKKGLAYMTSEKGQLLFNQSITSDRLAEVRTRYFDSLLKDGYQAIRDSNDRQNSYKSEDPIIFLDPSKNIQLKSSVAMTQKDIQASIDKYQLMTGGKKIKAT